MLIFTGVIIRIEKIVSIEFLWDKIPKLRVAGSIPARRTIDKYWLIKWFEFLILVEISHLISQFCFQD